MDNNDVNFKKYIKYKTKYMCKKRLIGGAQREDDKFFIKCLSIFEESFDEKFDEASITKKFQNTFLSKNCYLKKISNDNVKNTTCLSVGNSYSPMILFSNASEDIFYKLFFISNIQSPCTSALSDEVTKRFNVRIHSSNHKKLTNNFKFFLEKITSLIGHYDIPENTNFIMYISNTKLNELQGQTVDTSKKSLNNINNDLPKHNIANVSSKKYVPKEVQIIKKNNSTNNLQKLLNSSIDLRKNRQAYINLLNEINAQKDVNKTDILKKQLKELEKTITLQNQNIKELSNIRKQNSDETIIKPVLNEQHKSNDDLTNKNMLEISSEPEKIFEKNSVDKYNGDVNFTEHQKKLIEKIRNLLELEKNNPKTDVDVGYLINMIKIMVEQTMMKDKSFMRKQIVSYNIKNKIKDFYLKIADDSNYSKFSEVINDNTHDISKLYKLINLNSSHDVTDELIDDFLGVIFGSLKKLYDM